MLFCKPCNNVLHPYAGKVMASHMSTSQTGSMSG